VKLTGAESNSESNTLEVEDQDDVKLRIIDNLMKVETKKAPETKILKQKVELKEKT
jgi:hypothetical protein